LDELLKKRLGGRREKEALGKRREDEEACAAERRAV